MKDALNKLSAAFSSLVASGRLVDVFWLVVIVAIVWVSFRILRKIVLRFIGSRLNDQIRYLIQKAIDYTAVVVIVMTVFNRLGINFSALLGAAGIAGVAVGFAAQTSVSNVISGLFVMTERAFKIGDVLTVDSVTGVVETFDLLSVRLRTFDNKLVRIPNETIIKTNLVNITHYDVRRCDVRVGVAYGTDLRRLKEILLDIAAKNEFSVEEPAPLILFDAFADSSIDILFGVWGSKDKYLDLKNSLMIEVSERFRSEGISIPFPQRDLHVMDLASGSAGAVATAVVGSVPSGDGSSSLGDA